MSQEFKTWEEFTKEELISIAKMLGHAAYGDISLNFNDVFAPAASWGVDADQFDLPVLAELYETYGIDGVIAWGAVKEDVEEPFGGRKRYPKFSEAKEEILKNKTKYFWDIRYKEKKNGK